MTQQTARAAVNAVRAAAARFREIDAQIRQFIPGETWRDCGFNQRLRDLTFEEWKEITDAVSEHSFPCVLVAGYYGFYLCIHDHSPIQGEETEQLISIDGGQLPIPAAKNGFAGQTETLRIISSLTHSPRNAEVLAWYGFTALRAPEHYAY